MEEKDAAAPRMTAVFDSCGDYEKPHQFTKRLYEAGCAIEQTNSDLVKALQAVRQSEAWYCMDTATQNAVIAALAKAGAA